MLSQLRQIISKLSIEELVVCRQDITSAISTAYEKKADVVRANREESMAKLTKDYIEYHPGFVKTDSVEWGGITADVVSIDIKCKSGNTASRWLSNTGLDYTWETNAKKRIVNKPLDISKYGFINSLMERINGNKTQDPKDGDVDISINNANNIGIGLTNPGSKLHVQGTGSGEDLQGLVAGIIGSSTDHGGDPDRM